MWQVEAKVASIVITTNDKITSIEISKGDYKHKSHLVSRGGGLALAKTVAQRARITRI